MLPRMPKFARVIVDRSGSSVLDYLIPEELEPLVTPGMRLHVRVKSRDSMATVIEVTDHTAIGSVRPISGIAPGLPMLSPQLMRLGQWLADYYCCPLEAAMRSILPQVIRKGEVSHKRQLFARIAREPDDAERERLERRAPQQAEVLAYLREAGQTVAVSKLIQDCAVTHAAVQALVKKGFVSTAEETVLRDPHERETYVLAPKLDLNVEQAAAFEEVKRAIHSAADSAANAPKPILLHGVTGSGKTEIYLQAIDLAIHLGKGAIMLVPEISLTPQTVERFKTRFAEAHASVAVLHSHLSLGERHDEWHKIREGRARIVIGARSAVFAPVGNLGLIVVDEEHENSYKQEEAPRYHGRDVAVLRASLERCAVVLGSATPAIESFHNAATGKYQILRLTQRVDDRKMPLIRVIDMRQERLKQKTNPILSERLRQAITARLDRKEQSILFLNRRGFSTSLICGCCGYVAECPNCSVSLTYHRAAARVVCHICGHHAVVPAKCPECKDPGIRYSGTGTEKVEEAVGKLFPHAVIRRMDADAMARKDAYRDTLAAFRTGKIDILVGTQMIAKGLHFPNVTLVGIINADLALHLPDFRAGERTFQLLTQVAGRAGRGDVEGEVFVQSFTPFHPSIQFARHHDFTGFWEQEIEFREKWDYPPFTHMVLITVRSPHQTRGAFSAETLARRLRETLPPGTWLSEPAPAPLEKSRGNYRFHLVMRTRAILRLSRHLRAVLEKLTFPEDVIVTVDVDAYHLM
jgi:primosomal protein N' (replication factor Y)